MNIKLNQTEIEKAINENITKAVEDSLSHFTMRQAVGERISQSFANGVISKAIDKALASLDLDQLTTHLAAEIARVTTRVTSQVLINGMIETLMSMQGIASYDTKARDEARERLKAEFKYERREK